MAPEDEEMVVAAVDHLAKRIEDIAARLERA
jgi:cell division protein ZapA